MVARRGKTEPIVSQVKIVTDSSAYLPDPSLIAALGIEVVPLIVRTAHQSYPERVNSLDESLFRRLSHDPKGVSVEAPSLAQMRELYARLSQTTDRIVAIHVSSALSDIAEVAKEAARGTVGRQRIVVLDTATTSAGLGLIVEAAARVAAEGSTLAEVVKVVHGMIPHMYMLVFSDSLEFLENWGRLGSAQTFLGTMLGLKPIATMEDGDLLPVEKVRSYARAVDKLHDFIIEFSRIERLFLFQNGFETEAAQLLERLEIVYPHHEFPVIGYPPSVAVHVGPKALGVIVYEGMH